jgi:hypothetical protein
MTTYSSFIKSDSSYITLSFESDNIYNLNTQLYVNDSKQLVSKYAISGDGEKVLIGTKETDRINVCLYDLEGEYNFGYEYDDSEKKDIHDCSNNTVLHAYIDYSGNNILFVEDNNRFIHYQYDYTDSVYIKKKDISGLSFQSELYLSSIFIRGITSNSEIFTYDFSNNEQNYDVSSTLTTHQITDVSGLLFNVDASDNVIFVTQPQAKINNKISIIYKNTKLDIYSDYEVDYSGNDNIQIKHIDLKNNMLGLILSEDEIHNQKYYHIFLYEIKFNSQRITLEKLFDRIIDNNVYEPFIHIHNDGKTIVLYNEYINVYYEHQVVKYNPEIFEYTIESNKRDIFRTEVEDALQKWSEVIVKTPIIMNNAIDLSENFIVVKNTNPIASNYINKSIIHLKFYTGHKNDFKIVNVYSPYTFILDYDIIKKDQTNLINSTVTSVSDSTITIDENSILDMKTKNYDNGKSELYYTLLQKIGYAMGILNLSSLLHKFSDKLELKTTDNGNSVYNNTDKYYTRVDSKAIQYYNEIFNINYVEGSIEKKKNWTLIPIENDISDNIYPEEGYKIINERISNYVREISGNKYPGLGNIELLTPISEGESTTFHPVLSKITLGFLEDFGYTVDYFKADRFPEHSVYFGYQDLTSRVINFKNNIGDTISNLEVFTYDQILFHLFSDFIHSSKINLDIDTSQSIQQPIALNGRGNRIVIGYPDHTDGYGHVYIYDLSGYNWTLNIELSGNQSGDNFGSSVAINDEGTRIVIGSLFINSNRRGNIYIYDFIDENWNEIKCISGNEDGDYFGYSVAIDGTGNTVIFGSPTKNDYNGSVVIFTYINSEWVKSFDINSDTPNISKNDSFLGISVAINKQGNRIIIGGMVSAFIFDYSSENSNWVLIHVINDGVEPVYFHVDINSIGNRVVVGSAYTGSVQVWEYSSSWVKIDQDISGDFDSNFSIAINGNGDQIVIRYSSNQVNVYVLNGNLWILIYRIVSERDELKVRSVPAINDSGTIIALSYTDISNNVSPYVDFVYGNLDSTKNKILTIEGENINVSLDKPILKIFETIGMYTVEVDDISFNIIVKDQFEYEYNGTNTTATILSMIQVNRKDYDIYLPSITVSGENVKYKVNEISDNALKGYLLHECVVYGTDNLMRIGHSSFKNCSGLTAFLNCQYIEGISGEAFYGCNLKKFGNGYFPKLVCNEHIFNHNFKLSGFFPHINDVSGLFESCAEFTVIMEETFTSKHIESIFKSTEANKLFTISGEIMNIIDRICDTYILDKSVLLFDIINIIAKKFIQNTQSTIPFFLVNIQEYNIGNDEIPDYVKYIYIDISGESEFRMLEGECLYNVNKNDVKINEELEISSNQVYLVDKAYVNKNEYQELDNSNYWCVGTMFIGIVAKEYYFYIEHGFNGYQYRSSLYYKSISNDINLLSFDVKLQVLLSNDNLKSIDFHDAELKDKFDYFVTIEGDIVKIKYIFINEINLEKGKLTQLLVYRLPVVLKEISHVEYTLQYETEIFNMDVNKIRIGSETIDINQISPITIYAGRTYYYEYVDIKKFRILNKINYKEYSEYGMYSMKYTYDISKLYIGDFRRIFAHSKYSEYYEHFNLNKKYILILSPNRNSTDEFENKYYSLLLYATMDLPKDTKISGFILELNTYNFSIIQEQINEYVDLKYNIHQNKVLFYVDAPTQYRVMHKFFENIRIYGDEKLKILKIHQMTYFDKYEIGIDQYKFIDNYLINFNYKLIEVNVLEGWNLIGFSSVAQIKNDTTIIFQNTLYEYNNENQNLKLKDLSSTLDAFKGYFIKCKKPGILIVYTEKIIQNIIINLNLRSKWNLIGTTYDGVLHINNKITDKIQTYIRGELQQQDNTKLKSTLGYFIKCSEDIDILFSKEDANE